MLNKRIIVCLLNFLVAALMGLALRYVAIDDIDINYRFLTHAHSHVAMLGWVYLMLFTFIAHYFVPEQKPVYESLFWLTEFAVIGMMLSFPFQGYAAVSITFSTLHILCSYYFVYLIWNNHNTKSIVSTWLLKASLLFMLLSTIGVWCLGPAVGLMGKASAFYQIAIQCFLHFQFNGWFLFAVIALFFHLIKVKNTKSFRFFFYTLIASTILTLALPVQWFVPNQILLIVNGIGVILQLVALLYFFTLIIGQFRIFKKHYSKLFIYSLIFSLVCFTIKSVLQLISLAPFFAKDLYLHRNLVIGFIHLLMLGVISGFLFSFIIRNQDKLSKFLSYGFYSFLIGFAGTEVLLLIQGIRFYFGIGTIPNYYEFLFVFSILLPLGIGLLLLNFINLKSNETSSSETT